MDAGKFELFGLASLAAVSILAVGLATASRSGSAVATQTSALTIIPLVANAQAAQIEPSAKPKMNASVEEQAPIYLDLGAKF